MRKPLLSTQWRLYVQTLRTSAIRVGNGYRIVSYLGAENFKVMPFCDRCNVCSGTLEQTDDCYEPALNERCRIMLEFCFFSGGCSSVGRVPDCDSGCRGFESHQPPQENHVSTPIFIGWRFCLCGCKSRCELVTLGKVKRRLLLSGDAAFTKPNSDRAIHRLEEAWSISRYILLDWLPRCIDDDGPIRLVLSPLAFQRHA